MKHLSIAALMILSLTSCTAPKSAITASESQLMVRQAQTREFENVTLQQVMRAAIATLQDLSFILDKVDADLGTISASKYKGSTKVNITVSIREKGPLTISVRANATYGKKVIEYPETYQDFFSMLDKSLFLVKNHVN